MSAIVLCLCFDAMLADDYAVREHGSHIAAQLLRSRPSRCRSIAIAAAHHPSPEVRSRCARLVPRYRAHLAAAYVPWGVPAWPCVDMVPESMPGRWEHISRWHGRACEGSVPADAAVAPFWWAWRRATELWIRSELAAGWSYADADAVLAEMWRAELDYHATRYPQFLAVVRGWTRWQGGYPRP